jgi:uncharacterized protein YjgD (DUF1641 family)
MAETGKGSVVNLPTDQLLAEKLSDPQTVEQLIRLLDKLEQITFLFDMLENFLRRGPEIADAINDFVILFRENLPETEYVKRFKSAFTALHRIQEFIDSPQVQELFESDVLDVRTVQVLGKVSRSLIQAENSVREDVERIGLIGLLRSLTDPEIQPALSFLLSFARHLSKELKHA